MASGIDTSRDFVYGNTTETDWHKKTQYKQDLNPLVHFPEIRPSETFFVRDGVNIETGESVLISQDDGKICGKSFNPNTFGYILPQRAWQMISESLSGTKFTVERIGMLHDRSFWFASIHLDELAAIVLKGHSFHLNMSGSLQGAESPQGEIADLRGVCKNTINISRSTGQVLFKIKQTKNALVRLDNTQEEIEKAVGMTRVFAETMQRLENTPASVVQARNAYLGEAVRAGASLTRLDKVGARVENKTTINRIDSMVSMFARGDGNKGETRADVLNGFTQYMTRGDADSSKNVWAQIETSEFGRNADRKARFFADVSSDDSFAELVNVGATAK